jgi:shikimate kinase
LLKSHLLIYLTAEPRVIYQRIIARGVPAFFPDDQDPQKFFQQLWSQREKVYAKLADITVDNTHAVAQTVAQIIRSLEKTG